MNKKIILHISLVIALLASVTFYVTQGKTIDSFYDFWQTRNQQAQVALAKGEFAKAANFLRIP